MISNTPKVTILLSSYNHEAFIAHAINSALDQTFQDFELLIYDDASTDASLDVIRSFSDPRIRLVAFTENSKRGSLLKILPQVRGEYIAMLHSDDAWQPDKLEKQVAWLEANPNCGAVFTLVQAMDDDNNPVDNTFADIFAQANRTRGEWLHELFYRNTFCHPSVLIRTPIYQSMHASRMQLLLNDWRGWIELCLTHDIHILQEKLTWFRVHTGAATNYGGPSTRNTTRMENEISFLLELYRQLVRPDEWLAVFPEAEPYIINGRIVPDYALARICIATNIAPYVHYGLHLLAIAMDTEEKLFTLRELYGFTGNDYVDLCARSRVFSTFPLAISHRSTLHIVNEYSHEVEYTQIFDVMVYGEEPFHIIFPLRDIPKEWRCAPYLTRIVLSRIAGLGCWVLSCTVDGIPQDIIPISSQKVSAGDGFFCTMPVYDLPHLPPDGAVLELKGTLCPLSAEVLQAQTAKLERMVLRMSERLKAYEKS